jgi:hypothetical protein
MTNYKNFPSLEQLLAAVEEHYKRDEEACARAKVEREKWLDDEKSGVKSENSELLLYLIKNSFPKK